MGHAENSIAVSDISQMASGIKRKLVFCCVNPKADTANLSGRVFGLND